MRALRKGQAAIFTSNWMARSRTQNGNFEEMS
jgi:hypothetical protein